jgi:carboxyl-terminal processing protease
VEAHLASFDQIWETIRDVHYDPELNGAPWDELRETLRPRVAAARTDGEARSAMEELLASLGQSHFGVIPGEVYDELDRPSGPDGSPAESGSAGGESGAPVASSRNPGGIGQPGFDVVVVGDQAIVRRVVTGSPAERAGVAMGWVLSAVDGHDVSKGIAALPREPRGGSGRDRSGDLPRRGGCLP